MHWVYYFGRFMIHIVALPFASWKVKGKENLPSQGPVLIVSNHLHIADPPVVAASIPLKSVFMAKGDLWDNRWSRYWVENFGAFPVKRSGFDRDAIRLAEEWLGKGVSLIMFPEGGRSKTAQLKEALPGAALIAQRAGVPIVPVAVTGTEKLRNLWWCFLHHPKITVTIGRPFNLPPAQGKTSHEQRQEMIDYIMRRIAALLPPEYRGIYGTENIAEN